MDECWERNDTSDEQKDTSHNKKSQFAGTFVGGAIGALAPAAVYSAVGLSSVGPVAGGAFAAVQSAGMVGPVLSGL